MDGERFRSIGKAALNKMGVSIGVEKVPINQPNTEPAASPAKPERPTTTPNGEAIKSMTSRYSQQDFDRLTKKKVGTEYVYTDPTHPELGEVLRTAVPIEIKGGADNGDMPEPEAPAEKDYETWSAQKLLTEGDRIKDLLDDNDRFQKLMGRSKLKADQRSALEVELERINDAAAKLGEVESSDAVLGWANQAAIDEIDYLIANGGRELADYNDEFRKNKESVLGSDFFEDERLKGSVQWVYQRARRRLEGDRAGEIKAAREGKLPPVSRSTETASSPRTEENRAATTATGVEAVVKQSLEALSLNKHDRSIIADSHGYIEGLVEAMEDNVLDSKVVEEVAKRMEEVSKMGVAPPGYENVDRSKFMDYVWLAQARMHLYEAQRAVPPGGSANMEDWAKEMTILLGATNNSIAFYLRRILGESKDEITGEKTRIERIPHLNKMLDFIKDVEIYDDLDKRVKNFYQFGYTKPERDTASEYLLQYYLLEHPEIVGSDAQQVSNRLNELLHDKVAGDPSLQDDVSLQGYEREERQLQRELKRQQMKFELTKELLGKLSDPDRKQLEAAIRVSDSLYRVTLAAAEMDAPLKNISQTEYDKERYGKNPLYKNEIDARRRIRELKLNKIAFRAQELRDIRVINGENLDPALMIEAIDPTKPADPNNPSTYRVMGMEGSKWDELFADLGGFEYEKDKDIKAGSGNAILKSFLYAPVDFRARGKGLEPLQHLANMRQNGLLSFLHKVAERRNDPSRKQKVDISNFSQLLEAFQQEVPDSSLNSDRVRAWLKGISGAEKRIEKFFTDKDKGLVAEPISLENRLGVLEAYHSIQISRRKTDHDKLKELELWRKFEAQMRKICDPLVSCIEAYSNITVMNLRYLLYAKEKYVKFMSSDEALKLTGYQFGPIVRNYVDKIFFTHPKIRHADVRQVDKEDPENKPLLAYIESQAQKYENYTAAQGVTAQDVSLFLRFGLRAATLLFGTSPQEKKK